MAKWRKEDIFLHPMFVFKCMGCRDPYATFTEIAYVLTNFPIYNDKPEEYNAHALDRTFVCNLCGYRLVFGIALSKEHFNAIAEWDDSSRRKQDEPRTRKLLWTP